MGSKTSKISNETDPYKDERVEMIPDASHLGPLFCKSCWFENKGLIACHDHYLCHKCLTVLLTVSERCPLCKHPLPTKVRLSTLPTCPAE
ncbi:Z protein [Mammarenavirus merinoense]|uniref:Z protein n=1 Tax=Mammarenavirus merinoense TaxID=3052319 RepID=D4N7Z8_9VIRU|nr:Z protein [Mammarenavirus merinoense]ADD63339.1 Z protein [Mammarenavirus merinoense]